MPKKESLQHKLERVRPPRINITYDVEVGGAIRSTVRRGGGRGQAPPRPHGRHRRLRSFGRGAERARSAGGRAVSVPRRAATRPGRRIGHGPQQSAEGRRHEGHTLPLRVIGFVGAAALVVAVGAGIALASAQRWSPPTMPLDTVVARVHGEAVTWASIAEQLEAAKVTGRPPATDLASWHSEARDVIESVVRDVLTRHTMQAQGAQVTDAPIDAQIAALRQQYGGEAGLQSAMAGMHVSMAQLRETQRRGLYLQAMIDRFVPASDADVDAYLAHPEAAGLTRAEAAARVRAERAPQVIPALLDQLRNDPGVWVIDAEALR